MSLRFIQVKDNRLNASSRMITLFLHSRKLKNMLVKCLSSEESKKLKSI